MSLESPSGLYHPFTHPYSFPKDYKRSSRGGGVKQSLTGPALRDSMGVWGELWAWLTGCCVTFCLCLGQQVLVKAPGM